MPWSLKPGDFQCFQERLSAAGFEQGSLKKSPKYFLLKAESIKDRDEVVGLPVDQWTATVFTGRQA
jgi:hypothetical protein